VSGERPDDLGAGPGPEGPAGSSGELPDVADPSDSPDLAGLGPEGAASPSGELPDVADPSELGGASDALDPPEVSVPTGADLARSALEAARAAARRRPVDPNGRRVAGRRGRAGAGSRGGYSGAGPDPRDPQRFGTLLRRFLADRGWEATAATATVLARWDALVGAEIAAHCQPVSLRDGELTLAAESTAWATQLRLPAVRDTLLARIRAELGPEVVRRVRVHGPTAPTWRAGPRRIVGRGPRDTYG
jgi:predicted nucleic acid-binding Zn ribbon protein